jgi:hypothetical protein
MKTKLLTITAAVILTCLTQTGCVGPTYQSKTRMPSLDMGTPLKGVPSRVFLVHKFSDDRGVSPLVISGTLKLDQPVAEAFSEAVRHELERNGHKCVLSATEAKPDFVLDGSLVQVGVNFSRPSGLTANLNVDIALKLIFNKPGASGSDYAKRYAGSGQASTVGPLSNGFCFGVVDQAILNVLREFSTDPALADYLKRP